MGLSAGLGWLWLEGDLTREDTKGMGKLRPKVKRAGLKWRRDFFNADEEMEICD